MSVGESNFKTISIIIPVFNAEKTLIKLTDEIINTLEPLCNAFEILYINDGSQDQSWPIITLLSNKYSFIVGVNLTKNYGQHNALLCGIRQAQYPITITLDDDFQNLPKDIPNLLKKLSEGYDLVYGKPEKRKHGVIRNMSSGFIKIIFKKIFKLQHARHITTFRIFKTYLREYFAHYASHQVSIDVLLSWTTQNVGVVTTIDQKRIIGRSNYNYLKLIQYAINIIFSSSTFPLRIASYVGLFISAFSFFLLIYILIKYISSGFVVPGFTFLATMIALFSGVQLFTLGVLGEYLGRVYFTILKKPQYTINKQNDG